MLSNFEIDGGEPDSLIEVRGDPFPSSLLRMVVDRLDGSRSVYLATGQIAAANLIETFENSPDERIIRIEEFAALSTEIDCCAEDGHTVTPSLPV